MSTESKMAAPTSNIDDIWASMNENRQSVHDILKIAEKKKKSVKGSGKKTEKIETKAKADIAASVSGEAKQSGAKRASKKTGIVCDDISLTSGDKPETDNAGALVVAVETPDATRTVTTTEILAKLGRNLEILNSEENSLRRTKAVKAIYTTLFEEYTMSEDDYNEVFHETCKSYFKLFSDKVEKCREYGIRITLKFFEKASNFLPVLGYFMPCVMQRLPPGRFYDEDMKVFVADLEAHEAYRRGRAVERQDKASGGYGGVIVSETAEELRLLLCQCVSTLICRSAILGASTILHPYFHEIVLYLQSQLLDPNPECKMEACKSIEMLAYRPEFEPGMKYFAVGLVRSILPVLRHRHAKVRVLAVQALKACMIVPDRAKMKGSGTEAMPELVGFREENTLQVAAFYTAEVQVNYLAELVVDKNVAVREKVADMLTSYLTVMGDRYDHQTRLIPYMLDLLTDETSSVAAIAMNCLAVCGALCLFDELHLRT